MRLPSHASAFDAFYVFPGKGHLRPLYKGTKHLILAIGCWEDEKDTGPLVSPHRGSNVGNISKSAASIIPKACCNDHLNVFLMLQPTHNM